MELKKLALALIILFLSFVYGCIDSNYEKNKSYEECKKLSNLSHSCSPRSTCFPSPQYLCIRDLAKKYADSSLCNGLGPKYGFIGSDISSAGECGGEIAVDKNNPVLCNLLVENKSKDICIEIFAAKKFDYNSCDKIKDKDEKLGCYYSVVYNNKKNITDWSICKKFSDNIKFECDALAADATLEVSYCQDIKEGEKEAEQYLKKFVEEHGEYDYNAYSTEDAAKYDYYKSKLGNIFCYAKIAEKKSDLTVCSLASFENYCLLQMAIDERDHLSKYQEAVKSCKAITNAKIRKHCLTYVNDYVNYVISKNPKIKEIYNINESQSN